MDILISLVLITLSALFSGLTLGLLTLDTHTLRRRAKAGDAAAKKIYPLRKRGNLLLSTLLLGNVIVNTTLSVFLGSIASGVVAGIIATAAIFIFGEIVPQAVISRHALYFGSKTAPFVQLAIWLLYPVTYPIAYALDRLLGHELPTIYSKHEIMQIISEHEDSEHSPIDEDEERIVHGALQFSHLTVREVMTPAEDVVMYELQQRLTDPLLEEINDHGYSRYPVYAGNKNNIVGILFAKDLIVEDDDIQIKDAVEAYDETFLKARAHEKLDLLLTRFLKQRQHMAMVYDGKKQFIGVITLEDIIEEIIQLEIVDEDDSETPKN